MELNSCIDGQDVLILELRVENLDAGNVRDFKEAALALIQSRQRVVLDLSGVKFIDSSGLGALIA
jgi:anti-sigma B factor antagonist